MVSEKKELQLSKHWWNSSHFQLILFLGVILFIIFSLVEFINEAKMANSDEKSSNQNTSTEVQKEEWVERDGIFSREFKDFHGRVYKTEFKLTATTDKWSNPIQVSYNKDFDYAGQCSGKNEDGKIKVRVVSSNGTTKDYKGTCKEWTDFGKNLDAPLSLRFKAEEDPTDVWVEVTDSDY